MGDRRLQLSPGETEQLWGLRPSGSRMLQSLVLGRVAPPQTDPVLNWGPPGLCQGATLGGSQEAGLLCRGTRLVEASPPGSEVSPVPLVCRYVSNFITAPPPPKEGLWAVRVLNFDFSTRYLLNVYTNAVRLTGSSCLGFSHS